MAKEPNIEASSSQKSPSECYRILILDSPENVANLKEVIKDAGHSVVPAHTGEEALAFLEGEDHADVIVCAAHMKGESVFEFLRRVRKDKVHKTVKILMLALESGARATIFNDATEKGGRALGADEYITMPRFDAEKLVAEIERLCPLTPNAEQARQDEANETRLS